jgi:GNAT superfamily N-acetyltransferase
MDLGDFSFVRLSSGHQLKPFNCNDNDLNDFFFNDAKSYQEGLLAVTYILESPDETVAFFSLLNDKIAMQDFDTNSQWYRRISNLLPQNKRHKSYPAMKIGRLGVSSNFQGNGIGNMIIDYLKQLFVDNNRTGCKFITVDAYRQSLPFYEKNDFNYLTTKDILEDTRQMYFDLVKVIT